MAELDYNDIERFIGRYSIGRDSNPLNIRDSLHFLRIKIPGGMLKTDQLRLIAELSKEYGRERGEITDRQDIQLHWVEAEDAPEIFLSMEKMGFTTDMCGQGFSGARYGDVRNIICCPVSGIEKNELIDVHPFMKHLNEFFIGNREFQDMPKKFKFAMSGCGADCVRSEINDLGFVAVQKDKKVGFTMLVGGSMGASLPGPRLAQPTSLFIEPEDVYDVAIATTEIHRDYGNRESKMKARFKWLINEWGIERFCKILKEKIQKPLERYDGPIFLNDNDHHGICPQSKEGYHYVNIPLIGGILTFDNMMILAELADEYGSGELRLTPQQNVILPNIKSKDALIKELEISGFSLDGSKLRWNSMGCASDFCGKTKEPHAKDVVNDIVNHLESRLNTNLLDEARFQIHVSGCPNNCCATLIAGIGLEGKLVKEHGHLIQNYRLLVGGMTGLKTILARPVDENVPVEKLKYKIEVLLNNYDQERQESENLSEFCQRMPVEKLKSFMT